MMVMMIDVGDDDDAGGDVEDKDDDLMSFLSLKKGATKWKEERRWMGSEW